MALRVVGVRFRKKHCDGDFAHMVDKPEYASTLFVIAENMLDACGDEGVKGGGTACLRPLTYRFAQAAGKKVRAVGVPTGWSSEARGFPRLDHYVRRAIDLSLDAVYHVLHEHPEYDTLVFSCDDQDDRRFGTGIFRSTIAEEVVDHISRELLGMPTRAPPKLSMNVIRRKQMELAPIFLMADRLAALERENKRLREENGKKRPHGDGEVLRLGRPRLDRAAVPMGGGGLQSKLFAAAFKGHR